MKNIVNVLNMIASAIETFDAEEITKEDIQALPELFTELQDAYNIINKTLLFEPIPDADVVDAVEEEDESAYDEEDDEEDVTGKKITRIRMTNYDVELTSKFVAKKCNHASVDVAIDRCMKYTHNRFNKRTIERFLRGGSHKNISQKYFNCEVNTIAAIK